MDTDSQYKVLKVVLWAYIITFIAGLLAGLSWQIVLGLSVIVPLAAAYVSGLVTGFFWTKLVRSGSPRRDGSLHITPEDEPPKKK